jgi:hypothetical protein
MATNFRSPGRIEKRKMIQPHPSKWRGAKNVTKIELQEGKVVKNQVDRSDIHTHLSVILPIYSIPAKHNN